MELVFGKGDVTNTRTNRCMDKVVALLEVEK